MTFAQRLGFHTIDVGKVAGILAADLLKDYAPAELTEQFATQYLRTRYMQLVGRYGMPASAVNHVVQAGWKIAVAAGAVSREAQGFSFYE